MRTLALLGAAGMFGRDAAPLLRAAGWEVSEGDLPLVDIADPASVERFLAEHPAEVVLNAAAYTDVDGAQGDAESAHRANASAPGVLARACSARGALLVHLSTDYVFPGTRPGGYGPGDPTGPAASVYGQSKLAGEEAVRAALPEAAHLIVRTQWLYGSSGKSFPRTILGLARERPELRVVDDQWGVPTWTRHLAAQVLRLLEAGARGTRHAAGGGGPVTWHAFAAHLVAEAGLLCRVLPCATEAFPRPAPRPRHAWLRDPDEAAWPHWHQGVGEFLDALNVES